MLVAAGMAIVEVGMYWRTKAALDETDRQNASLLARLEAARAGHGSEAVSVDSGQPNHPKVVRVVTAKDDPATQARIQAGEDFMNAHPEVRRELIRGRRAVFLGIYRPFLASAGLSPGQIDEFLLIKARSGGATVGPYLLNVDGEPSLAEKPEAAQLHDLLGEAGYAKYLDFENGLRASTHAGDLVSNLAQMTYFTSSPLTLSQADRLRDIVDASAGMPAWGGFATIPWDDVLPAARSVLSADQFAALEALHRRALAMLAASGPQDHGTTGSPGTR